MSKLRNKYSLLKSRDNILTLKHFILWAVILTLAKR